MWTQHHAILTALAAGDAEHSVDLVTVHVEGAQAAILGTRMARAMA